MDEESVQVQILPARFNLPGSGGTADASVIVFLQNLVAVIVNHEAAKRIVASSRWR